MPILQLGARAFAVDDRGFLTEPEVWDEEAARLLAAHQGVELDETRWRVVRYLRTYWETNRRAPLLRSFCAQTKLSLGEIYELFPKGPTEGACCIAGLPKPEGCV